MRRRSRHFRLICLLAIVALAATLRLVTLDRAPLWADEIFSLAVATGHSIEHPAAIADARQGDYIEPAAAAPASYFQTYLRHETPPASPARVVRAAFLSDTSPPLYYLLLWAWTQTAGTSDLALRGFSTLWALLCFPILISVARQLGGRPAMIPAALLFALSPLGLYYSNEGRMYSLIWFLVLCLLWLALRLRRNGARPILILLWSLVATAGLLTHYFFLFVLGASGLWLLIFPRRLHRGVLIGSGAVVGLLVLPWYLHLPESFGNWRVTAGWLEVRPYNYKPVVTFLKFAWNYVSSRGDWGTQVRWDLLVLAGVASLGALLARRLPLLLLSRRRMLLVLVIVAALLGPVALDLLQGTYLISVPRYAMAALPAALILLAIAISWLRWWGQAIVYVLILAGWLPAVRRIVINYNRMEQPYRQIAGSLKELSAESDVLIAHSIPTGIMGLARYMPPEQPLVAWTGQLGQREVPRDVIRLGAGRKRIVVVKVHDVWSPAVQAQWLNDHARLDRDRWSGYAQILYYAPRSGEVFSFADRASSPR